MCVCLFVCLAVLFLFVWFLCVFLLGVVCFPCSFDFVRFGGCGDALHCAVAAAAAAASCGAVVLCLVFFLKYSFQGPLVC